ncbi:MAG: SpvB/TcaC N-terminal domain-containing protein [Steroidobacter sp.]
MSMSRKTSMVAALAVLMCAVLSVPAYAAVGKIDGSFTVGADGSANYTVPLWIPPGPHGLKPSLSLTYNSGHGNGDLGVGWSLAGLSSITVCNFELFTDGGYMALTLGTNRVRYCMNGHHLQVVGGNDSNYGKAGSVYQLDISDFSRITLEGIQNNMPTYFRVEGKDGLIYEYGHSADSQLISASGYAYEWRLNRVSDPDGNSYTVTYTSDGTQYSAVVASIQWSPMTPGGSNYQYQTSFHYSQKTDKKDQLDWFISDAEFKDSNRLDSITVGYSASGAANTYSTVRQYQLTYETSPTTSFSRLKQVQECTATTSDCLKPTVFTYQTGDFGVSNASVGNVAVGTQILPNRYDFNGDGRNDLVFESGSTWKVEFSTGSGFTAPVDTGISTSAGPIIDHFLATNVDGFLVNVSGIWNYVGYNGSSFVSQSTGVTVAGASAFATDNNGDGIADLVWVDSSYNLMIQLNTTTGSASKPSFGSPFVALTSVGNSTSVNVYAPGYCAGSRHCDINGDHAVDLGMVYVTPPTCGQYGCSGTAQAVYYDLLSNGAGGYTRSPGVNITNNSAAAGYWGMNFNNDKCIDKLMRGIGLYVSGCGTSLGTLVPVPGTPVMVMDWDGDGRTDLVVANGNTLGVYLSTGNTASPFSQLKTTGIPYNSTSTYFAFDMDGDGLDDIGVLSSTGSFAYYTHAGTSGSINSQTGVNTGIPDILLKIADGYGNAISTSYVSGGDSYTPGTGTQLPLQDEANGHLAVGTVTYDNQGSSYTQTYTYKGARVSIVGGGPYGSIWSGGFVGFEQINMVDSRNALLTERTYDQSYPYVGHVESVTVYHQWDLSNPISQTINTLEIPANSTLTTIGCDRCYFPHVKDSTTTKYEVGGSKDGQLISTTTTTYVYNDYGNTHVLTQTVKDDDALTPTSPTASQSWTTTTTTNFSPSTGSTWCLNQPTQIVVSHSTTNPGENVVPDQTTNFTPDYAKCRIKQKVVDPGSSTYQVTTDYGYDDDSGVAGFGNVTKVTVTGIGMTSRVTSMQWNPTGQYVEYLTDAAGEKTQTEYDRSTYLKTDQWDANQLKTHWAYTDGFGLDDTETHPDGTTTTYSYQYCSDTPGVCPSDADLKYWVDQIDYDKNRGEMHETRTIYNQLDQLRYVLDQNLNGGFDYKTHREYDALGHVVKDYVPGTSANAAYHVYTLDVLGRVTTNTLYNADTSQFSASSVSYLGFTTRFTDAQNKQTTRVTDVNGWMRQIQDTNGYAQNFNYDAAGNLLKVVDSGGNQLFKVDSYDYGIKAFRRHTTDIDLGAWSYTYDALGEVINYTDAKSQTFNTTYDALSRPVTRSVTGENTTRWTWGSSASAHEIGQLKSICNDATTGGTGSTCTTPTYKETYTYDSDGRLSNEQIVSDATYNYDYTYNPTTQLLDTLTYPTSTSSYRLKLKYGYSSTGILNKVSDANNLSTVFWQANSINPYGEVTQEALGNGIISNHAYDPTTGWLRSIQAGVGAGTGVQNESYLYDLVGNVIQRQNNALGLTESFCYDNVYRLTKSALSGDNTCTTNNNLTMTYDVMGNIARRSDVANNAAWTYNATHKHQVTQAGDASHTYTYDNNGNAITRNGQSITWNKYNYPTTINGSGESVNLYYDANLQRWKQVYVKGSTTETTIYAGGLLQKVTTGSTTDYRYQIYGGDQLVAVMSRNTSGTNAVHYVLQDHQGSLSKITNSTGTVYVSENFTAFGDRRNPATWSGAPTSTDLNTINAVTRDGYTGQTALGSMGLNHMNGRVEDAITGRFLSADPHLTDPGNTQNYNRYSYVYNNPMSYTDPTGFDSDPCPTCEGITVYGQRPPPPPPSKPDNDNNSGVINFTPSTDWAGTFDSPDINITAPDIKPTCPMVGSTCGTPNKSGDKSNKKQDSAACTAAQNLAAQLSARLESISSQTGWLAFGSTLGTAISGAGEGVTFGIDTPVTVSFGSMDLFFSTTSFVTGAAASTLKSFANGNLDAVRDFNGSQVTNLSVAAMAKNVPGGARWAEVIGGLAEQIADVTQKAKEACQ